MLLMSEQSTTGPSDRSANHLDDEKWLDWPRCPKCGRNRQTFCPTCDIAGDQFPLAEYIPAAAPVERTRRDSGCACKTCDELPDENLAPVLLMCPSCDEAFAPKFYRLCEECGHDFGDGRQVELPEPEELTGRALLVMVALVILTIGILGYLWYLFRS
jgi:hypothetical protein